MVKVNKQSLNEVEGQPLKVWSAMSSTDQGIKHYVFAMKIHNEAECETHGQEDCTEIVFVCSCKGSQFSGTCWHRDEAQEKFDEWVETLS